MGPSAPNGTEFGPAESNVPASALTRPKSMAFAERHGRLVERVCPQKMPGPSLSEEPGKVAQ